MTCWSPFIIILSYSQHYLTVLPHYTIPLYYPTVLPHCTTPSLGDASWTGSEISSCTHRTQPHWTADTGVHYHWRSPTNHDSLRSYYGHRLTWIWRGRAGVSFSSRFCHSTGQEPCFANGTCLGPRGGMWEVVSMRYVMLHEGCDW